jgi:hypothetical protein
MPALFRTYLVASRLLPSQKLNRSMEVTMTKAKWLLTAGLVALTTAGCVQETTTYAPRGAAYYPAPQATYYSTPQPTYYQAPQVQTQAQARNAAYWNSPRADADRDGIPNRYDRDANGDRVPDRYQGR